MSLKYEPALEPLHISSCPLSGEYGTCKTVMAKFWPWLSGKGPRDLSSCTRFAGEWFPVLLSSIGLSDPNACEPYDENASVRTGGYGHFIKSQLASRNKL